MTKRILKGPDLNLQSQKVSVSQAFDQLTVVVEAYLQMLKRSIILAPAKIWEGASTGTSKTF